MGAIVKQEKTHSNTHASFTIREGTLNDAESITMVHIKGWQDSYKGIIKQSTLDALSYGERFKLRQSVLNDTNIACFVAEIDARVVGFCDVGPARTEPQSDCRGEIYAIYILEKYQRMGIGSTLWTTGISFLHKHGLVPYMLWTLEKNQKARQFYENQSGIVCGTKHVMIDNQVYNEVQYCFKN